MRGLTTLERAELVRATEPGEPEVVHVEVLPALLSRGLLSMTETDEADWYSPTPAGLLALRLDAAARAVAR